MAQNCTGVGKDNMLKDSYTLILEDPAFLDWWDNNNVQLLWIKGDPDKGKTMLMIGQHRLLHNIFVA